MIVSGWLHQDEKLSPHSGKKQTCVHICLTCNAPALSLQPGEVVYEENCEKKCTCQPDKGLVCEQHSCPQKTKCIVRKGVRACYHTGKAKQFSADNSYNFLRIEQLYFIILMSCIYFSKIPVRISNVGSRRSAVL